MIRLDKGSAVGGEADLKLTVIAKYPAPRFDFGSLGTRKILTLRSQMGSIVMWLINISMR